ncbi:unnamed protein product [Ectocarpus sp. 8 AP-2014]
MAHVQLRLHGEGGVLASWGNNIRGCRESCWALNASESNNKSLARMAKKVTKRVDVKAGP